MDFDVLHVLPFDSTRKRMSVILKHPMTNEIILYTKVRITKLLAGWVIVCKALPVYSAVALAEFWAPHVECCL